MLSWGVVAMLGLVLGAMEYWGLQERWAISAIWLRGFPQHRPPWWFQLALKVCPGRCREIPEAVSPHRIVLRQVALWKRHVYLQQFAGAEDAGWFHSHQWRRTFAIGLCGSYYEERVVTRRQPPGAELLTSVERRSAPYFYTMDSEVKHRVAAPSAGHTSLFVGIGRDDSLKFYHPRDGGAPVAWDKHIQKMVARI